MNAESSNRSHSLTTKKKFGKPKTTIKKRYQEAENRSYVQYRNVDSQKARWRGTNPRRDPIPDSRVYERPAAGLPDECADDGVVFERARRGGGGGVYTGDAAQWRGAGLGGDSRHQSGQTFDRWCGG